MKKSTSSKRTTSAKALARKKAPARKASAKPAAKAPARKRASAKKVPEPETKVAGKATIAEQAKAAADTKTVTEDKPAKASGFSMDDVRRILKDKSSQSATDEQVQKTKTRRASATKKTKQKKKKFAAASVFDILGFNPSQKKTLEECREEQVPKKFLSYYRVLLKLREELQEDVDSHSQGTLLTSSKEESGDLSTNSSDSGSESFDRDVALSMVASEQEALNEVEAAIDRIFDGSFGICQETGKSILRDRLKAVPFTRFSLEGQALHEQSVSRHVQRGGIYTNLPESVPGMQTDDDS